MKTEEVAQKIWSLCNILRGDGITYYQYVSELTYLLFLKIAEETGTEDILPDGYRWNNLFAHPQQGLLGYYQEMLTHLGASGSNEIVRTIYAFPTTVFSHEENLKAVVDGIAQLQWGTIGRDQLGDVYSSLISKSADARSGAGQYFTPPALVDVIVSVMAPKAGEVIQDPAVGSGGFLVAADTYIRKKKTDAQYRASRPKYQGVEIEKNTRRICLMNTFLHDMDAEIIHGDALTADVGILERADLVLANPPFGAKAGSLRTIADDIPFRTANKQLLFLQRIWLNLKEGGRAAIVLPDNVLFEMGVGKQIRQKLLAECNVHTILRLPSGIFTGAGVKTNVIFLEKDSRGTDYTWIYDMRSGQKRYGRNTPLELIDFDKFLKSYRVGEKINERKPSDKFRKVSMEEISKRDYNLDLAWIPDSDEIEVISDPRDLLFQIQRNLSAAALDVEAVLDMIPFASPQDDGGNFS